MIGGISASPNAYNSRKWKLENFSKYIYSHHEQPNWFCYMHSTFLKSLLGLSIAIFILSLSGEKSVVKNKHEVRIFTRSANKGLFLMRFIYYCRCSLYSSWNIYVIINFLQTPNIKINFSNIKIKQDFNAFSNFFNKFYQFFNKLYIFRMYYKCITTIYY